MSENLFFRAFFLASYFSTLCSKFINENLIRLFVVVQFSRTVVFCALPSSAHVVYHIYFHLSILFLKFFQIFLNFFIIIFNCPKIHYILYFWIPSIQYTGFPFLSFFIFLSKNRDFTNSLSQNPDFYRILFFLFLKIISCFFIQIKSSNRKYSSFLSAFCKREEKIFRTSSPSSISFSPW